jgi:hypothetical protein
MSQSRKSVPSAVISREVPQPARFEKKKNKCVLPETKAPTLEARG